ncbi:MAG TPA: DegT/DnrJ/EryC1/StrS family aminotransferase [Candidatus Binataceae bacterium]|nr:DegT/DnrJ/EryC1/StrS family aminotransferase [Candidatus Binataceae bacterium]
MNRIKFVDLTLQYAAIQHEVDSAIAGVLRNGSFILGPAVRGFEEAFAAFLGVKHAIGVASGLDALRLGLASCGIGVGDEVIVPANTYIATALAVSGVGATPVLVDCLPDTFEIDSDKVEKALTPRTRAIIPVHLTGLAADMDQIVGIARRHGLVVVEDAAQAHGTLYHGRACGTIGRIGCFSFYPGKNLGAYGDGGAIVTDDPTLAEHALALRNYGQRAKYQHEVKGFNSRLDSLQAAVLNVKLAYLRGWNQRRVKHAAAYRDLLQGVGDLGFQRCPEDSTHVYHLFIVTTDHRDELKKHLEAAGIETGVHYPIPIHMQPAYRDLGYREGDFPVTESLAARMLSLPMFPELEEVEIARVAEEIRRYFASAARTQAVA